MYSTYSAVHVIYTNGNVNSVLEDKLRAHFEQFSMAMSTSFPLSLGSVCPTYDN